MSQITPAFFVVRNLCSNGIGHDFRLRRVARQSDFAASLQSGEPPASLLHPAVQPTRDLGGRRVAGRKVSSARA